jgi:hypothetical protein
MEVRKRGRDIEVVHGRLDTLVVRLSGKVVVEKLSGKARRPVELDLD